MPTNDKIKERRKGFNPNIKGDPAINVKTDQEGTSDVPATKQKDIDAKKKDENSNSSNA